MKRISRDRRLTPDEVASTERSEHRSPKSFLI